MAHKKRHKSKYGTPRKGTKRREIILLLMRPSGTTTEELFQNGLIKDKEPQLDYLRYDCGFDVQIIDQIPNGIGRRKNVYRIIGRWRWNGRYRSFL